VKQDRRRQQQRGEAEHHGARDVVVQGLVDVERDASDQREVHTHDRQADLRDERRTAADVDAADAPEVAPHAVGVQGHSDPRDDQRAVEEAPRRVAVRAELAEVELPPQRLGRREDRQQDAADEDHEGCCAEVHRRQS